MEELKFIVSGVFIINEGLTNKAFFRITMIFKAIFLCSIIFFSLDANDQLYFEATILDLVKKYIPDNPVIVEAGAHHGEDTLIMSKKWPHSRIYAFEPLQNSFEITRNKVSGLTNVTCYNLALSNKAGKAEFYICQSGEGASSLLKPQPILDNFLIFAKTPVTVECVVLDEWAKANNVKSVDFMWLDMEGAELMALKASPKILKTVKAIYTEVNFQEFREGNCFYDEIKGWLEEQGFKEIWSQLNTSWQGNVLFVRSTLIK